MMIEQAKDVSTISAVLPLIEAYWRFEQIDHFDQHHLARLLQQLIEQPQHGSLWLAHKGNQYIAYLLLTYQFSLEYGGMIAEIDEMFVLPSARSLGVGKAMLQVAEQHLRKKKASLSFNYKLPTKTSPR